MIAQQSPQVGGDPATVLERRMDEIRRQWLCKEITFDQAMTAFNQAMSDKGNLRRPDAHADE